jgi:hypothetical protein
MLILGHPQFPVQDDEGFGDGIPPIPEWLSCSSTMEDDTIPELSWVFDDKIVRTALVRLRHIFKRVEGEPFPGTKLHDIVLFVTHRLLLSVPDGNGSSPLPVTECIRYALVLYMFIIQGPTYYSHAVILNSIVTKYIANMERLESIPHVFDALDVWLLTIGSVASAGTPNHAFFAARIRNVCVHLDITDFHDMLEYIRSICWIGGSHGEDLLCPHWNTTFADHSQLDLANLAVDLSPIRFGMQALQNDSPMKLTFTKEMSVSVRRMELDGPH